MCRFYHVFVKLCTLEITSSDFISKFYKVLSQNRFVKKYIACSCCLFFNGRSLLFWSFRIWYFVLDETCHIFSAIDSFALLQSGEINLHIFFQIFHSTKPRFNTKRILHYLNTLPNYTLFQHSTEPYPILKHSRTIFPHSIEPLQYPQV